MSLALAPAWGAAARPVRCGSSTPGRTESERRLRDSRLPWHLLPRPGPSDRDLLDDRLSRKVCRLRGGRRRATGWSPQRDGRLKRVRDTQRVSHAKRHDTKLHDTQLHDTLHNRHLPSIRHQLPGEKRLSRPHDRPHGGPGDLDRTAAAGSPSNWDRRSRPGRGAVAARRHRGREVRQQNRRAGDRGRGA